MNYYPFHLGDYSVSTRALTWDEHAAYRMLLDLYYASEAPISLDRQKVYRQTMARTKRQRAAIDLILEDYFTCTPEGWVNERCERELAAYRQKGERAQQAGMASAAARRARAQQADDTAEESPAPADEATPAERVLNDRSTDVQQVFNARSTGVQPTNNQEPITKEKKQPPLPPVPGGMDPGAVDNPAKALADGAGPPSSARQRDAPAKAERRRTADPAGWSGVMVPRPEDVDEAVWRDFCALRKTRRAPITPAVVAGVRREAGKAGATAQEALAFMVERGHQGFIVEAWARAKSGGAPPGRAKGIHEFDGLSYGAGGTL